MSILDGIFFGVLIAVIAIVSVTICYLAVFIFDIILNIYVYLKTVYRRWLWNRKSPEEKERITKELLLHMPSTFPLNQFSKQFNSNEYEWKENDE